MRSSAVSPSLKLPPILSSKAASAPEVAPLPPQNTPEVMSLATPDSDMKCPSAMDMSLAYDNMMGSYFMTQSFKSQNAFLSENFQVHPLPPQQIHNGNQDFGTAYAPHILPSIHQFMQSPCDSNYMISQNMMTHDNYHKHEERLAPIDKPLTRKISQQTCVNPMTVNLSPAVTQDTSRDVTPSGCTLLDGMSNYQQQVPVALQADKAVKPEHGFGSNSIAIVPSVDNKIIHSTRNKPHSPVLEGEDKIPNITDMYALLNELSCADLANITDMSALLNELSCADVEKHEMLTMDDNLLVMQGMQELEGGNAIPGSILRFSNNIMHPFQIIPESENLQVLPQDVAAFRTEDFLPYIPPIVPTAHSHIQTQYQRTQQPLSNEGQHNKPLPMYDQHMPRKVTPRKNNSSSESNQPSNSFSFASSEGEKTIPCSSSSSTVNESNKIFTCRWLDCKSVSQDQEEFVAHIEKVHVDQKNGDDFICFWKLCPRRLHPFNARYKLLIHMRVHSGDKPNKCTYSGCKKAFATIQNLKVHLRSHTGERPYNCTYPGCTKTFSNSSDRTKHQKTHHDTKPYVCQAAGCGKRYTNPSSLRLHVKEKSHGEKKEPERKKEFEKSYVCQVAGCDKRYMHASSRWKHVKKDHPEQKEPDGKKIKGGVEELDPKDLNECLMIQAIKPITLCDASPPGPTDSVLGRSPRGSQPASSADHYPGPIYAIDNLTRSQTAQGSSSHISPSSHHSSPFGPIDRENS